MKTRRLISPLLLSLVLISCSTQAPPTPTPQASAPSNKGEIRMGFTSEADLGDVPVLMALDLLAQQGYTITPTYFSTADVAVTALANGDMDMGTGSTRTHWAAISKGGKIRTLMEEVGIAWILLTTPAIKTCQDLDKQRLALNSAGGLSTALFNAYVQTNCPTAKPQVLYIPNSQTRLVAFAKGEADAAMLETSSVLEIERDSPGKFNRLVDFAKELPRLKTTAVYANTDFAARHPESVKDYIRTLLGVHRRIKENPDLLKAAVVNDLKFDVKTASALSDAYLSSNVWDVNGGMDQDAVAYSIDFFTKTGSLAPGLTVNSVADLSYLNGVLSEIGRK